MAAFLFRSTWRRLSLPRRCIGSSVHCQSSASAPFVFVRWCNIDTGRFGLRLFVFFVPWRLAEALAPNPEGAWCTWGSRTFWERFLVCHLFISSVFSLAVKCFLISSEGRSPTASHQTESNTSGVKGYGIGVEALPCSLTGRSTLYVRCSEPFPLSNA